MAPRSFRRQKRSSLTTTNNVASILITHAAKLPNGTFQLGFTNIAGSTNEIFASTNAGAPFMNWVSLGTAAESPERDIYVYGWHRDQCGPAILPRPLAVTGRQPQSRKPALILQKETKDNKEICKKWQSFLCKVRTC